MNKYTYKPYILISLTYSIYYYNYLQSIKKNKNYNIYYY